MKTPKVLNAVDFAEALSNAARRYRYEFPNHDGATGAKGTDEYAYFDFIVFDGLKRFTYKVTVTRTEEIENE